MVYELEFLVGASCFRAAARRAARPDVFAPRADINCELFDVDDGNKLSVAIATRAARAAEASPGARRASIVCLSFVRRSLSLDGTDTSDFLQLDGKPSLLDQYDYVMHGIVYKFKHVQGTKVEVLLSHGGLLARFVGDQRHLQKMKVDSEVYTLIRKTA